MEVRHARATLALGSAPKPVLCFEVFNERQRPVHKDAQTQSTLPTTATAACRFRTTRA
jgi:hypothetical protein